MSLKSSSSKVSSTVKVIVESHPSILDCMALDVINYSALARCLYDEVSRRIGRKTTLDAIKMSLIRLADDIKGRWRILEDKVRAVLAESVLELQTDLIVLTVRKDVVSKILTKLVESVSDARFFQLTQGTKTYTLIVAREVYNRVVEVLGEDNIEDKIEDQSAITLISPIEIVETPGVIALITFKLASHGINITQVISCYKDTILVFSREDALKAYQLLEELVLNLRRKF